MKKKICVILTTVLMLALVGCGEKTATETVSTQDKKQNKERIEEAMENADFDKAKELTADDNDYKDLHTALDIYMRVANDVKMEWVHVKLDNDEESEFKERADKLNEIPKVYKKYPELKSRVDIHKNELKKAVDLENNFRKNFKELDTAYQENKSDEYNKIAREWMEKVDREFPIASEESYEANLESVFNDIFKNRLAMYTVAGIDPSKTEGVQSPYEKVQEENKNGDYDEVFTPESSESSEYGIEDEWISPDDVKTK